MRERGRVSERIYYHLPYFEAHVGYTNDQQLYHECHSMTFGVQVRSLISWNIVMRCMPMLHNGLHVDQKCTQLTLVISMLYNIFLLHTKCKHMALAISTLKNNFPLQS